MPARRLRVVAVTTVAVVVLDQLTKSWAVDRLSGGRTIDLIGSLRFRLASNKGAAFSLGQDLNIGPFVAVLALGVVVLLVMTGTTTRSTLGAVAVGMVAGGALGNLADRAFRSGDGFMGGGVVDFIDVQWWPIFNIADSAVSIGAVGLLLVGLRAPPKRP